MDEQIIALGGGGFSMEDSPLLDDYILHACAKPNPKICFVPTASGDADGYVAQFYRRFAPADCRATDLQLFRRQVDDLEAFACAQDIIYIGGGNTVNMLAIWRSHGFDQALRAALTSGTLLTGLSAGSICWFEQGITDSFGSTLQAMEGLGFLPGSHCPHYDGEAARRPAYHRMVKSGMLGGWAADDGVGLHFVNGSLHQVVSSRRDAKAYRVDSQDGEVREVPLAPRFLRDVADQQADIPDAAGTVDR